MCCVFAPSQVTALAQLVPLAALRTRFCAIGETTAAAVEGRGRRGRRDRAGTDAGGNGAGGQVGVSSKTMNYPDYRPRRMRRTENLRRMIRETRLALEDFIYPLFVVPGSGIAKPIGSLPGQFNYSDRQGGRCRGAPPPTSASRA